MSVRAMNVTSRKGITHAAPTPGSRTQARNKGFKGTRAKRKKGGGLNSHWSGFSDSKAHDRMPGAPKRA